MNYTNYEISIVQGYGVQLINWLLERGVVSPLQITNTADRRKLHNALKSGECKWKQLTATEVKAHADELDARRAGGEVVGKPRKRRSDAGVKRKRLEGAADKENERPKKHKKVVPPRKATGKAAKGRKSQVATSREFISDSDESESSASEGEDDE